MGRQIMKSLFKSAAVAAIMAGAALFASVPANAQVGVHIGIGLPGVHIGIGAPAWYYGPGYFPPGPCDAYNRYYEGDCGYAVYSGPVVFDGVVVDGPHYYRWSGGHPVFWYRSGWHEWSGWAGARWRWDHDEGYGWHDGHWDRDWGRQHWHPGAHDWHSGWHPDHH